MRLRQRERLAARAAHGETGIKLGGRMVTFAIANVGDPRRWGAAVHTNNVAIRLAGRNIHPREVRLGRLKDLSARTRSGRYRVAP